MRVIDGGTTGVATSSEPRMDAKQLIALIRGIIAKFRADHIQSVTVTNLAALLDDIENHISQPPQQPIPASVSEEATRFAIEHAKLQQASDLAGYEARAASARDLFKSVITTAKVTINALILINGGAAVALLAFIGHLATAESRGPAVHAFAAPLAWFVIGLGAAALFAGSVAGGQKLFAEEMYAAPESKKKRLKQFGNASVVVSIFFGLCSLSAFAVGNWFAYCVFSRM